LGRAIEWETPPGALSSCDINAPGVVCLSGSLSMNDNDMLDATSPTPMELLESFLTRRIGGGRWRFFSCALGLIILRSVSPVVLLFYLPPRLPFPCRRLQVPRDGISMMLAIAPVAYRVIFGPSLKTDW
jgi:hypothetical protein